MMSDIRLNQAKAYCRRLALSNYENFTVGSFLLPKQVRQHIYNIYAYCRISDNLADESGTPEERLQSIEEWENKLVACYEGDYQHDVFLALSETIDEFTIPIDPFKNLLIAFKQDQTITRYDTFNQLLGYCRNSANPVGRIYLYLFNLASPEIFQYSDKICTALQLTNFWQDVRVDLRKRRIYIPKEDLTRFDCHENDLEGNSANTCMRKLIAFQVKRTQQMFDDGKNLLNFVSNRTKFEITLFIQGGESILQKIRSQNYDVLKKRPSLNKLEKLNLILKTIFSKGQLSRVERNESAKTRLGIELTQE